MNLKLLIWKIRSRALALTSNIFVVLEMSTKQSSNVKKLFFSSSMPSDVQDHLVTKNVVYKYICCTSEGTEEEKNNYIHIYF